MAIDNRPFINHAVIEIWAHPLTYGVGHPTHGNEAERFERMLIAVQEVMTANLPAIVYSEFRRLVEETEDAADAEVEMRGDEVQSKEVEEGASGDHEGTTDGDPKAGE